MLRTVDFSTLIRELRESGVSQNSIARETGYTQANISQIARGKIKDPAWPLGDYIIRRHAEVFRAAP